MGGVKPSGPGARKAASAGESAQLYTVPCPVLTATGGGASGAHLTYLCVGGLAQWVVAMPDDRYRSLRLSMRRTFTKSLGEEELGQGLPSPRCRGRRPAWEEELGDNAPGGDDTARSPCGYIIGDEGVVFHSLQDLWGVRGDMRCSAPQENPSDRVPALQETPRPACSLLRSLY